MIQTTDYPFSGDVSISVHPAAEKHFSVGIRVPNRDVSDIYSGTPPSDGVTSIALNGARITPPIERGYAVITRSWKAGDKIDLALPMTIQRIKAIDRVAATRGRVALRYGPLIYCAESVDQDLDNVLDSRSALRTEWKGDLLGGVMVIQGTWANGSELTAIPYYARSNRGGGNDRARGPERRGPSSSVWLRDQ
jgi:DUF1680 family protein